MTHRLRGAASRLRGSQNPSPARSATLAADRRKRCLALLWSRIERSGRHAWCYLAGGHRDPVAITKAGDADALVICRRCLSMRSVTLRVTGSPQIDMAAARSRGIAMVDEHALEELRLGMLIEPLFTRWDER